MMEQRGEPLLLVFPCSLPHAMQSLGHLFPGLGQACAPPPLRGATVSGRTETQHSARMAAKLKEVQLPAGAGGYAVTNLGAIVRQCALDGPVSAARPPFSS